MKIVFKTAILALSVVAGFALQSCGKKAIDTSVLESNFWLLKSMNGKDANTLFDGPIPSLEFNFTDSMIYGNSGCNQYFGRFHINRNNKVTASNVGGTLKACIFDNQEPEYLDAISKENMDISLDNNEVLVLKNGNTKLEYIKGNKEEYNMGNNSMPAQNNSQPAQNAAPENGSVQPAVPLTPATPAARPRRDDAGNRKANSEIVSGVWVLKGIANENIDEIFENRKPTINFQADGLVTGNGGCNNYRSTYTFRDHELSFAPIASTRMACPGLEGETRFIQFLQEPVEAYLNSDSSALLFFRGDDLVLEFVRE